jgi:hypothetical protein
VRARALLPAAADAEAAAARVRMLRRLLRRVVILLAPAQRCAHARCGHAALLPPQAQAVQQARHVRVGAQPRGAVREAGAQRAARQQRGELGRTSL